MNEHHHAIIVGSGPAGLAAADTLSRHGLSILVIDDNAQAGGQLLRCSPHASGTGRRFGPGRFRHPAMRLTTCLKKRRVRFLHGNQVLGIFPQRTLLVENPRGKVSEYRSAALILATGARERQLPFKGWTLPGVMAAGAAQILMKSSAILPGESPLVAGCGPLLLPLAAQILASGGRVLAVLDQGSTAARLKAVTAGPAVLPGLFEGLVCLAHLAAARIPVKQDIRIVEARGREHLETVVTARVNGRGRIVAGTEQLYSTDTLAVGYGFVPNTELPRQAGCALSWGVDRGGWHVNVNSSMATTVPGVYVAGEATGIAGAGKSLIEGRIAAWRVLYEQGRVSRQTSKTRIRPLLRRRAHHLRYGRFINRLCHLPPHSYTDIPDDTTVCRCEEISMGEIRRQARRGFSSMDGIKKATRCGMGNCQGRICGPILSDILSDAGGKSPQTAGCVSARAPVKTVALASLAEMAVGDGKGPEHPVPDSVEGKTP